MKCVRRPDLDAVTRVHIAAQAFLSLGVYGELPRIANAYRVSRLFVYKLRWQLRRLDELEACDPGAPEAIRTEVDRHILLRRLEGHGALERIAQSLRQLGLPFAAVGSIAPRLAAYVRALPHEEWPEAQIVFLLCDEILTRGQPMLITVEPRSLAMLKIELAKHREAATWKQPWDALAEAGLIEQQTVVSDQGAGVVKGGPLMGLRHHPDLFHLLRPLAICGERFSRKALAAIARADERGSLAVGRSEAVSTKQSRAYEAAQAEADEQIRRYDKVCDLWTAWRQTRALFDAQGEIPALASRQAEIAVIVQWLAALSCAQLLQALASCASGVEGSWGYDQRAEQVDQASSTQYPRAVGQALALAWP